MSETLTGDSGSKVNNNLFVWDPAEKGWELQKGDGAQIVRRTSTADGDMQIQTLLITDAFGNDAAKTHSIHQNYSWGTALVQEIQDPDGDSLVTDYTYYTDETDAARLGKVESVKYPDGSWEKYIYDDDGRKASVWSSWLDGSLEQAANSNCKRKDTSYEPVDPNDIAQNTSGFTLLRPRLVTEYIEGIPVRKTALAYYVNATERIEKTVEYDDPASSAYGDTANRVSTSICYLEDDADADLADNIKQTVSPEGLTAEYGYTRGDFAWSDRTLGTFTFTVNASGDWVCETSTTGNVGNPDGLENKTTRRVSYRNALGGVELSETRVYTTGSSYERIGWTANEYDYNLNYSDAVGHVINRYFSDGTMDNNDWNSCCGGLEGIINRQGQQAIYDYDALGRRDTVTRVGEGTQSDILVVYGFDAAGRQVSMTESGDGLARTTGSNYDLAGQLKFSTSEAGLVTHYDYQDGGRITTVTMPGGATQITETYIDGRTKRSYGTGVVEQTYEYGFEPADGSQWTTVYTGSEGTSSPRWQKTVTDADGKTLRTERPGYGGTLLATVYHYDTNDRAWKTEQREDGVVKTVHINEFDDLGNVTRSGLDVDKSDSLDLASMDRITDSDSNYWYGDAGLPSRSLGVGWWRVSTSTTYPEDGVATALQVSKNKSRLTGLGTSGTDGLLTSENVREDVFGNQATSQSWLDRTTKTVTQIVDIPTSTDDQISISVNGLLQSVQSASDAGTTTYGYDGLGRQTTMVDPRIGTATTHYNTKGQVDWTEDTHGVITDYAYDSETGQRFSNTTDDGIGELATTYVEFDNLGNLVRQWGSATYPVAYDYDDFGQKTHMHTYRGGSGWGSAIWEGDSAAADTTEWVYDPATGLLAEKLYADGKGPSYTYWPNGKLHVRTWARLDDNDDPLTTTYTYYDTGEIQTADYSDATPDITYTHYRTGQQRQIDDAQGTRVLAYTTEGQLDTETLNGALVIDRAYDSSGRSDGYSAASVSPASSIIYGYDTYGRFDTITSTIDSETSVVDYSYVPNSSLSSGYTAQDGGSAASLTVTKTYETDRNLIDIIENSVTGPSAFDLSTFDYTNDDLGRRTRRDDLRAASISPAQSYWEFDYNLRSELTDAVRYLPDTTPVAGQVKSYQYDNIGNRRKVDAMSPSRSEIYTANSLNQYTSRTVPSTIDVMGVALNGATVTVRDYAHNDLPAPVTRQGDYFFKAYPVDNLTQAFDGNLEVTAVINPDGTTDPDIVETETRSAFLPQTPEAYVYDDDGNLLSDGRWSYTWNAENRLIQVQTLREGDTEIGDIRVTFQYDYQGRRYFKIADKWAHTNIQPPAPPVWIRTMEHTYLYYGNRIIHEEVCGQSGDAMYPPWYNTYVWGQNDHLVAASLRGTTVFYAHDANKNSTDLVDVFGNVVAQYDYDSYGNQLISEGDLADENSFRFSNEYFDAETGMSAYKFRYYNPETGRWLNRDPIAEQGGLNVYGFVENDSISNIDLFGLDFIAVGRAPVGLNIRGRDFGVAGHMSIIFFEEKTKCPAEGTDFTPAEIGQQSSVFAVAIQRDQYELRPSHHQYVQKYTISKTIDILGLPPKTITVPIYEPVSVSFIENSASPTKLHVIYADTRNGKIKDTARKWRIIASAAKSYAYAEQPPRGKEALSNWPNSKYRLPNQTPGNNSNTFIHYMSSLISRSADVFQNTPGDKSPSPVYDPHPTPVLWKSP